MSTSSTDMSRFRRTGGHRKGYKPSEVHEFFNQAKAGYERTAGDDDPFTMHKVRQQAFSMVRNGYEPADVDYALDRLMEAFVRRERAEVVSREGDEAWLQSTYGKARTLYPRLKRLHSERFAMARRGPGYHVQDVDDFLERIRDYFESAEPLTADEVLRVTFRVARRGNRYDEASVDEFLDRVYEVLASVE